MIQDLLAAAIEMLKADADLALLVAGRIYGDELPEEEAEHQPRPAVVLRHAPGPAGVGGYVELQSPNFDALCVGETPEQAMQVYRALCPALKQARRQVVAETLIHSFDLMMSPRALRDTDTKWPYVISTWKSLASEKQAT